MLDVFLEERRRGLQRWLLLMSHHPILSNDEMFKIFLTDISGEQQTLLEEAFARDSDEFEHSLENSSCPQGDLQQLLTQRDLMRLMLNHVIRIKRIIEQQAKRGVNQSTDFLEMSQTLDAIIRDTNDNSLQDFSKNFSEFSVQSEKVYQNQQRSVIERLIMVIEVITAHLDMCDRVEKAYNYTSLAQMKKLNINTFIIRNVIRPPSDDDKSIDERNQNESEILNKRRAFSLQCVRQETKLAENYLKLLPSILLQYSNDETKGFAIFSEIFSKIVQIESDKLN